MPSKKGKYYSRRDFLRLAASSAAVPLAASLAPNVVSAKSAYLTPHKQEATVSVWGWPTQLTRSRDAEGNELIEERVLNEAGVNIELNLVDQPDLAPRLRAALPAGNGPDVITTDFDVMGPYWQFMMPLNELAEAEWGPNWKTDVFSETALNEMEIVANIVGRPGDAMYLPGNMQLLGWPIYWIPDFEANDIDPQAFTSFDDFVAACQTLKDAGITPIIGADHPAALADWYKSLVEVAAPGKMAEVQRGIGKFTDPDMVETFNLIAMIHNEYMQEGAIATDAGASFDAFHAHAGAMSMTFTGTPWFGFLNSDNEDVRINMRNNYGTFQMPGSKGLASTDAGVAIVDASQNKDAAWEYIKWVTVGKGAEYDAQDAAQPFGAKSIVPAETGTDFDTNLAQPLFEALQTGENVFRRILCPDVYNAITVVIPGVVTGQISAEIAAADVQEAFDRNCGQWIE
ncbi:MAG: extracellular solute-binding protein [Anaerolineae bacterium]|nr:extracellular solute-binding protein [Anaerolineae bacterium]